MPRFRSSSTNVTYTDRRGPCNAATGAFAGTPAIGTRVFTRFDEMTDIVTPGFRRESAKGRVINNAMERLKTSHSLTQANVWFSKFTTTGNAGYRAEGYDLSVIPVNDPRDPAGRLHMQGVQAAIADAEAIALTDAFAKVGIPDAESLTSIAEMRETLSFMLSPVRKIKQLASRATSIEKLLKRDEETYLRRLAAWSRRSDAQKLKIPKPEKAKRKIKLARWEVTDIPSLWLAFRYGVMPLIYDVQDHWKAFNKVSKFVPRATARGKASDTLTVIVPHAPVVFGLADRHSATENADFKISVRAGVLYVPRLETLLTKFGLEAGRIPSTLWEVVPLSFVVDWAINMSDVLNALTAYLRVDSVLSCWVTTTVEWNYLCSLEGTPLERGQGGTSTFREEGKWTRRRPASIADVRLKVNVNLNAKRVADAFALASLFLNSLRKK